MPAGALPTLTGVSVNKIDPGISWAVAASLDVAKSRDIQHSQEVTVFRPPGRTTRHLGLLLRSPGTANVSSR